MSCTHTFRWRRLPLLQYTTVQQTHMEVPKQSKRIRQAKIQSIWGIISNVSCGMWHVTCGMWYVDAAMRRKPLTDPVSHLACVVCTYLKTMYPRPRTLRKAVRQPREWARARARKDHSITHVFRLAVIFYILKTTFVAN